MCVEQQRASQDSASVVVRSATGLARCHFRCQDKAKEASGPDSLLMAFRVDRVAPWRQYAAKILRARGGARHREDAYDREMRVNSDAEQDLLALLRDRDKNDRHGFCPLNAIIAMRPPQHT